jgi:hypothetical protein
MTTVGSGASPAALPLARVSAAADRNRRLGRAIAYVWAQNDIIADPVVRAKLASLLFAGRSMDFAARLRGLKERLSPAVAEQFATQMGIGAFELRGQVLPALKSADVIDFALRDGQLVHIEEYVGLTAPLIEQGMRVLGSTSPSPVELGVLHSVELASWAPLTARDHLDELIARGLSEQHAREAIRLSLACGANLRVQSSDLNTTVIYNPNVWGAQHASIAGFLSKLPPAERGALLGVVEMASDRPGLALANYSDFNAAVLQSARKVGLVQAAEVRSSLAGASPQTYVFSPLLESADNAVVATEALHERKLFVAHMLYGHEKARAGRGVVRDPLVLVDRLLARGYVGPASNITTDYHLLESRGIVHVEDAGGGRSYLNVVKEDVVRSGLSWLEAAFARTASPSGAVDPGLLGSPLGWTSPEASRARLGEAAGAAREVTESAVLQLRAMIEEAQRVTRFDFI